MLSVPGHANLLGEFDDLGVCGEACDGERVVGRGVDVRGYSRLYTLTVELRKLDTRRKWRAAVGGGWWAACNLLIWGLELHVIQ